jgi:hypothetical protein
MMTDETRDHLSRQLIKLGDMMGDGLHYEDKSISREYKRVLKALHPEMFPKKKRSYVNKPSISLKRTMKLCICGVKQFGWERKDSLVRFYCVCGRDTGFFNKNSLARDEWNKGIGNE